MNHHCKTTKEYMAPYEETAARYAKLRGYDRVVWNNTRVCWHGTGMNAIPANGTWH